MADIYASNWNETDANNSAAAPDGAGEGMAPSGVNNTMRAMMGATKRYVDQQIPKRTAGSSTAYTLAYDVAPGALVDGMTHLVEFDEANGASATLNINALGAIPLHILKPAGWGVIPANTVIADMVCRVAYHSGSGTYRVIEGPMSAVHSSGNGYSVGPNAVRTQWGATTSISPAGSLVVTFPVAFSASPYSILITGTNANDAPGYIVSAASSNFNMANPGNQASSYYWFAVGPA